MFPDQGGGRGEGAFRNIPRVLTNLEPDLGPSKIPRRQNNENLHIAQYINVLATQSYTRRTGALPWMTSDLKPSAYSSSATRTPKNAWQRSKPNTAVRSKWKDPAVVHEAHEKKLRKPSVRPSLGIVDPCEAFLVVVPRELWMKDLSPKIFRSNAPARPSHSFLAEADCYCYLYAHTVRQTMGMKGPTISNSGAGGSRGRLCHRKKEGYLRHLLNEFLKLAIKY